MSRVSEVKFTINLEEMFGERVPDDADFRGRVAQAVIDRIVERTQDGVDKHNKKFRKYSKEYAKRKGVDPGDVDMTLFGDMLENIDVVDDKADEFTLGFQDEKQNAKAFNHTTGDTLPRRDFFGLPVKELAAIAESFRDDLDKIKETGGDPNGDQELKDAIKGILAGEYDSDLGIE